MRFFIWRLYSVFIAIAVDFRNCRIEWKQIIQCVELFIHITVTELFVIEPQHHTNWIVRQSWHYNLTGVGCRQSKYNPPVPSLSMSAIIFLISSFFGSNPSALIATWTACHWCNYSGPFFWLKPRTAKIPFNICHCVYLFVGKSCWTNNKYCNLQIGFIYK